MVRAGAINAGQIQQLLALGRAAGDAILAIYRARETWAVATKADDSPLTAADLAAQTLISRGLPAILDLPQVSEEAVLAPFAARQHWDAYWLVDPLDGTKEFIAGSGEFTVNIALISAHRPVLGLVHAPVLGTSYLGVLDAADPELLGAWKSTGGDLEPISSADLTQRWNLGLPLRTILSHRHTTAATARMLDHLQQLWPGGLERQSAGSSLKFCLIAEGAADFYPRLAPTCEWDSAAAQAVLEAAGGSVVTALEQSPEDGASVPALVALNYNQSDKLINPFFYALADRRFNWQTLFSLHP